MRCRYLNVYMRPYDGYYFTGDGCYRDKDGYYWVTGSVFVACIIFGICQHATSSDCDRILIYDVSPICCCELVS